MNEIKVFSFIDENLKNGRKVVMAMITDSKGSSPRKSGSIMAVNENGEIKGTIGGGELERKVMIEAEEVMRVQEDKSLVYQLNDKGEIGMKCGGEASIYMKVFIPKNRLIVAGCGHVGKEIYTLGKYLNFNMVMMDDREEFAQKRIFSEDDTILKGDIFKNLNEMNITENDYIVIVTRGHKYDADALKAVVDTDAKYIGMIGSKEKILHSMKGLLEQGVTEERINKVYSPIGLDIDDGSPKEIALAVLSEIIKIKNNKTGQHMKHLKFGKKYFK